MSKYVAFVMVCVLLTVFCPLAFGDEILLKNGDRLTGKIVRKDGPALIVETDALGTVTIKWSAIKSILSDDPVNVELLDGKMMKGKIGTKDGERFQVSTPNGIVEVQPEKIKVVRSESEQSTFENEQERLLNPRFKDRWSGSLDLGFNVEVGNSDSRKLSIAAKGKRKTARSEISYYGKVVQEKEKVDNVAKITDQEVKIGGRYIRNLDERSFLFAGGEYEYDKFESLDLRTISGGGYGYRLIRGDEKALEVFGGGVFTTENFSDGTGRKSAELLVGQDFKYELNGRIDFEEKSAFFIDLTHPGEVRSNFEAIIVTKLNRWLGWQFKFENDYDSNPAFGSEKNDFEFTTGLRIVFGNKKRK